MNQRTQKLRIMVQLSFLLAIMVILTFTPLGFIMLPTGSITIMHIPVIIGAIIMGPAYGGMLGGAFGLLSMLKATISAAGPVDMLFTPAASGNPLASVVMTVVPRILLGVLAGVLFRALCRFDKHKVWSTAVSAGIASVLHTVMVLGCLSMFFGALSIMEVFLTLVTLNGILELLAAVVITTAVCKPLLAYLHKK